MIDAASVGGQTGARSARSIRVRANCLTQAEVAAANVAVTVAVLREPVHRFLAEAGGGCARPGRL